MKKDQKEKGGKAMTKPKTAYIMADIVLSAIQDNNLERHEYSKKLVEVAKTKAFIPSISDLVIAELNALVDDASIESLKTVLLDLDPIILLYTRETYALAREYEKAIAENNDQEDPDEEPDEAPDEEPDELLDSLNQVKRKNHLRQSQMSFEEIKEELEEDFAILDKRLNGTLSHLLKKNASEENDE
jgi:hypothetical protein